MRLALAARDVVLASWETDRERVARAVYPGLEPAELDGRHVVSLVALRYGGGRLGRLPVPPFSQLNVRTYVVRGAERAVYFLRAYVSLPGVGGALLGAPYRPVRLRVAAGLVEAPGIGVSLPYRPGEPGEPGELGRHELGLFEAAGLRSFRVRRRPARWRRAEVAGTLRADVLLALGFELAGDPTVFYAEDAAFEAEIPPKRLDE